MGHPTRLFCYGYPVRTNAHLLRSVLAVRRRYGRRNHNSPMHNDNLPRESFLPLFFLYFVTRSWSSLKSWLCVFSALNCLVWCITNYHDMISVHCRSNACGSGEWVRTSLNDTSNKHFRSHFCSEEMIMVSVTV